MNISIPLGSAVAAFAAVACHWCVVDNGGDRPRKAWRMVLPAAFGSISAVSVLAVASLAPVCIVVWNIVLLSGATVGAIVGRSVRLQVDHIWGLVRVAWGKDTMLGSLILMLAALGGSAIGVLRVDGLPWACTMALAAGFCAGMLDGGVWSACRKVLRTPHSDLSGG